MMKWLFLFVLIIHTCTAEFLILTYERGSKPQEEVLTTPIRIGTPAKEYIFEINFEKSGLWLYNDLERESESYARGSDLIYFSHTPHRIAIKDNANPYTLDAGCRKCQGLLGIGQNSFFWKIWNSALFEHNQIMLGGQDLSSYNTVKWICNEQSESFCETSDFSITLNSQAITVPYEQRYHVHSPLAITSQSVSSANVTKVKYGSQLLRRYSIYKNRWSSYVVMKEQLVQMHLDWYHLLLFSILFFLLIRWKMINIETAHYLTWKIVALEILTLVLVVLIFVLPRTLAWVLDFPFLYFTSLAIVVSCILSEVVILIKLFRLEERKKSKNKLEQIFNLMVRNFNYEMSILIALWMVFDRQTAGVVNFTNALINMYIIFNMTMHVALLITFTWYAWKWRNYHIYTLLSMTRIVTIFGLELYITYIYFWLPILHHYFQLHSDFNWGFTVLMYLLEVNAAIYIVGLIVEKNVLWAAETRLSKKAPPAVGERQNTNLLI